MTKSIRKGIYYTFWTLVYSPLVVLVSYIIYMLCKCIYINIKYEDAYHARKAGLEDYFHFGTIAVCFLSVIGVMIITAFVATIIALLQKEWPKFYKKYIKYD